MEKINSYRINFFYLTLSCILQFQYFPFELVRAVMSRKIPVIPLSPPGDSFWVSSVVLWHEWMAPARSDWLEVFQPDFHGRMNRTMVNFFETEPLIKEEIITDYTCDIQDIHGMSSTHDSEHGIAEIDDFPGHESSVHTEPVTEGKFNENINHYSVRLNEMSFDEFPWGQRNLYWRNVDGSHHFSAARYLAVRLGKEFPLSGLLSRYSVNHELLAVMRNQWSMYLMPKMPALSVFTDIMGRMNCPFRISPLPGNMHVSSCKNDLCVVWLERHHRKANAVAHILALSGFPDFGKQLDMLKQAGKNNPNYCKERNGQRNDRTA